MLVLLGPPFQGTEDDYARLASGTGLLAYDLKTKIKPGAWGVVRAIADPVHAQLLTDKLRQLGFRIAIVDPGVASAPDRMFVPLRAIELGADAIVLHLSERAIPIPYRALCAVVRGEVTLGSRPRARPSSTSLRAPTATEVEVFRESATTTQFDAYAAVDLHFATVLWSARIDVRSFDFSLLGNASGSAQDLDRVADLVAERAGLRVDRSSRVSSVASFGSGAPARQTSPVPGAPASRSREAPERFDAYSRLVAEAERQALRSARGSTGPPPPT